MNQDTAEKLLRAAVDFAALSASARETCRETYRRNERETDNTLRILVDGQVASLGLAMSQKIAAVSESTSYQIGVSASFIRTHFVLGDHILNGDLVEALTLIRKQLESVARLHELDSTPLQKLAGKVPNIKSVLARQAARVYGDLSEVAHFSTSRVSALLHVLQDGDRIGPGLCAIVYRAGVRVFRSRSLHHCVLHRLDAGKAPCLVSQIRRVRGSRDVHADSLGGRVKTGHFVDVQNRPLLTGVETA